MPDEWAKGVAPYDGLVGLYRHTHEARYQSAGAVNLLRVDVGFDVELLVAFEYHGHLFERGVAGAFADTVDGYLGLTCPVENTRYGVGRGHAQVVVAVGGDDGLVDAFDILFEEPYLATEFLGQTVTCRVGNVYHRSTGFDDSLDNTGQVFIVGAARVFGVELLRLRHISWHILQLRRPVR